MRDPLWHSGHGHEDRHQRADGRAHDQPNEDPLVLDDLAVQQRAHDCQHHADLGQQHARVGGLRRVQGLQAQIKSMEAARYAAASRMSLIVVSAPSAPKHLEHAIGDHKAADHVDGGGSHGDGAQHRADDALLAARRDQRPTREMPEIALVVDISGVCSKGGTRRMTSYPTNPARTRM